MGFRFQKRISILPGLRINLSKSGASVSVGIPGASLNLGKKGVQANLGIPGTGLSYRHHFKGSEASHAPSSRYEDGALHSPQAQPQTTYTDISEVYAEPALKRDKRAGSRTLIWSVAAVSGVCLLLISAFAFRLHEISTATQQTVVHEPRPAQVYLPYRAPEAEKAIMNAVNGATEAPHTQPPKTAVVKPQLPQREILTVASDKARVRAQPDISAAVLVTLDKGFRVYVFENRGDWYHVGDATNPRGWMHKSVLTK